MSRPTFDEEFAMSVKNAPTSDGKSAARSLLKETSKREEAVEVDTGHAFKKGAVRFDERSKSSDGKSAGEKQKSD